jgi:RNA polymerase sigma-70 factor, ECF subfamily
MTCCRKPGCGFIAYGTPIALVSPSCLGSYAIARHVRVDGYRRTRRITLREIAMEVLPERLAEAEPRNPGPAFDTLVAALPEAQREVITMLKVGGLSLEEVARATSSTVGAVKQKAHRAYQRLRKLLQIQAKEEARGAAQ